MASPYEILGIDASATKEQIKKAYRRLSLKYHPDTNRDDPDATKKFQEISSAYKKLDNLTCMNNGIDNNGIDNNGIDNNGLDNYDNYQYFQNNINSINSKSYRNARNTLITSNINNVSKMSSIRKNNINSGISLHDLRRDNQNHNNNFILEEITKPACITITVNIDITSAYTGCTEPVRITRYIIEETIRTEEEETLYIDIPEGIDSGEIIFLENKGHCIANHICGDIKITIVVTNNFDMQRKGLDLIYEKNLTLKDALCGFSFNIKHIDGKNYTINTKNKIITANYNQVLPKMGFKRGDYIGNLIIKFNIKFPDTLSEEQINKLQDIF